MHRVPLLYLVNDLQVGSSNRRIVHLVENLDRSFYEIHVGCLKSVGGPMIDPIRAAGACAVNFANDGRRRSVFGRVVRYIRQNSIHVVHSQVLRSDLIGGLATRLGHGTLAVSTKCNSCYLGSQRQSWARNPLYWSAMYLPDRIITVSEALRQEILEHVHRKPDHVMTIHTGIRASDFYKPERRDACRSSLGLSSDALAIGYLGRLTGGKGLEDLLLATRHIVRQHQKCRLIMVGDGEQRASLERFASELGLEGRVLFTGFRSDIPDILAAIDILTLPSLTEGLPQSVLEAMAAGKAVVATAVGGVCEVIQPGITGFLVPQHDPVGLAATVSTLLRQPDTCAAIGQRAREHVLQHFDLASMVKAYDAFYRGLLASLEMETQHEPVV